MPRQPSSFSERVLAPALKSQAVARGPRVSLREQLRDGPWEVGPLPLVCTWPSQPALPLRQWHTAIVDHGAPWESPTLPAVAGERALPRPDPHVTTVLISDSSFGHSRLVKDNLIDFFVPFLPLEYRHVRLCARDAFLSQKLPFTEEDLDQVARMMVYVPQEEKIFSFQGCKLISQRINYFLP